MRLLIVRTSALGDVVHCLPVLSALRRALPEARIGWVVEGAMAPLLEGHPDLDELLVVELRAWRRRPLAPRTLAEVGRFIGRLVAFSPDVALDLMGNHKGGILAALSLADRRLGLARRHRREPSSAMWINEPVEPRGIHAVDQALSMAGALFDRQPDGRKTNESGAAVWPAAFDGDKLFARDRTPAPGPDSGDRDDIGAGLSPRPLLIHPGAGWGNKRYPAAWWGEAGAIAAERTGRPLGVLSGPGEEALAAEVAAHSGGRAEVMEAVGLPALTARLRGAALVLAGDTGPLHLAHAVGTPVLCLMGPTDPERNGPYGAPERALFHRLPCSFCHRRFDEAKACLLEIPPERVASRAVELLAGGARDAC